MQGTRVRALVWEGPTCRGATGPVSHQLLSLRVWSLCSATREAAIVRGPRTVMKSGPRLPQLEKALAQKRRPNTAINLKKKKKKKKVVCHPLNIFKKKIYLFILEQRKVYCKAMQGDEVAHALKSLELPEGFWQSIFKSQVAGGRGGARYMIRSCTILIG